MKAHNAFLGGDESVDQGSMYLVNPQNHGVDGDEILVRSQLITPIFRADD